MTRKSWSVWFGTVMFVAGAASLGPSDAAAQARTLDIGGPPGDTALRRCATDSLVTAALAAFNSPAAVHASGDGAIEAGLTINGGYAVYHGFLRVDGTVRGDVIVLNGDVRITGTAVVTGSVTVLGGRLTVDPGAQVAGKQIGCEQTVSLTRAADGTITRSAPSPSLGSIRSAVTWSAGDYRFTPHLGISGYNRVEEIPVQIGINVARPIGRSDSARAEIYGIVRTARDPSGSRAPVGWFGSVLFAHNGAIPVTLTIAGGSTLRAAHDRPFSDVESGLSTFVLRRDYNDWYLNRGGSVTGSARATSELTLAGEFEVSHQTTVQAVDAFSLLRNTETWRPNPLIDDGRYNIATGRLTWNAADERRHPVLGWFVRAEVQRVWSGDLTPVSVPTSIRDALPVTAYGATTADFDLRAYLRLDPEQHINFRLIGGGHVGGNALTIQNRRAIGGADPLLGYDFRAINCDRRRKVDPAMPALCDRSLAFQVEYHRALPIELQTQIGGYTVGIRRPDLVIHGDMGSAWLAGDSAGRVPANRIQALREWRSDIGIGITSGPLGLYLSKALTDPIGVQLNLLLSKRF